MTLADWIVASVTLHYLGAALVYWAQGNGDAAGAYVCYAGANVFLIRLAMRAAGLL